jgi:hypothetical protein
VHPDVRAVGAEPHFFDRSYHKGLAWYRWARGPPWVLLSAGCAEGETRKGWQRGSSSCSHLGLPFFSLGEGQMERGMEILILIVRAPQFPKHLIPWNRPSN